MHQRIRQQVGDASPVQRSQRTGPSPHAQQDHRPLSTAQRVIASLTPQGGPVGGNGDRRAPSVAQTVMRSVGAPIQMAGSGGIKMGFEKATGSHSGETQEIETGLQLLQQEWTKIKSARKLTKDQIGIDMASVDESVKIDMARMKQLDDIKQTYPLLNQYSKLSLVPDLQKGTYSQQSKAYTQDKNRINQDVTNLSASQTLGSLDPQKKGLTGLYYKKLVDDIPDEDALLRQSDAFKGDPFALTGPDIMYKSKTLGPIKIATLRTGDQAFHNLRDGRDGLRTTYAKHGFEDTPTRAGDRKEYVKDSRGALTRRYAWVEKNYYQMMEFFMVEHMTGRFQQYMLAGGDRNPGVSKITTDMIRNVPTKPTATLSPSQIAVSHQMYGSLPEQRGVSLTSTPKVGVTYANTGGNFRTDDGFKLKIDLARVPDDVLFMNHYGAGGVSEMNAPDYSTRQTHKTKPYTYKYKESALHARELYLEHIRPEWVVEIEHHKKGGFKDRDGDKTVQRSDGTEDLLATAKRAFGGDAYEKGFEIGLTAGIDPTLLKDDPNYVKGKGTGNMFKQGYDHGVSLLGRKNANGAFNEIMGDNVIADKMSPWHLGYIQGRTGQVMVTSAAGFRRLMNTAPVVLQSTATPNSTFSLLRGVDSLSILYTEKRFLASTITRTTEISYTELASANIKYEADEDYEGGMIVTIPRKSADVSLYLSAGDAERFKNSLHDLLQQYVAIAPGISSNGMPTLLFDATDMTLNHQIADKKGGFVAKTRKFVRNDIRAVTFETENKNVTIWIDTPAMNYNFVTSIDNAKLLRKIMLDNGLNARLVGAL